MHETYSPHKANILKDMLQLESLEYLDLQHNKSYVDRLNLFDLFINLVHDYQHHENAAYHIIEVIKHLVHLKDET